MSQSVYVRPPGLQTAFLDAPSPSLHRSSECQFTCTPLRSQKAGSSRLIVSAEGSGAEVRKNNAKGWFYETLERSLIESKTKDALKAQAELESRGGRVGTWFEDAYKYTPWPDVYKALVARKVKTISCSEALNLAKRGAVMLDCREAQDFTKIHVEGAKNAPLFRLIEGWSVQANIRRVGYALLTDFAGTERNPKFLELALAAVKGDKRKQVVVYCTTGGTLVDFVEKKGPNARRVYGKDRRFGRPSRSLKTVYELQEAGFTNLLHMEGGLNEWIHEDLPLGGTD